MIERKKRKTGEKIRLFKGLFVGLSHVYGTYDPVSGRVRQVKKQVTDRVLLEHLMGQTPYGVYLLVKDLTRAVAVDFDSQDQRAPANFFNRGKHYNIFVYIERSKSKGYHAWVFFDGQGVLAFKARMVVRHILEEIQVPDTEIFPKQDLLDTNLQYGNFINAPLFGTLVHQRP